MKQFIVVMLFAAFLSGLSSCTNPSIKKPENLIPKDKFINMMVDIYLVKGYNPEYGNQKVVKKISSTNLYYSVLKKYSVPDTVFIRSLIYYSSFPKEYEKMHVLIMNELNQKDEQFKPTEKLKVESK